MKYDFLEDLLVNATKFDNILNRVIKAKFWMEKFKRLDTMIRIHMRDMKFIENSEIDCIKVWIKDDDIDKIDFVDSYCFTLAQIFYIFFPIIL